MHKSNMAQQLFW